MGGLGSGNRYRWSTKTTVEESYRIDIRWMRKQGLLRTWISGGLNWTRRGEPSGNIRYLIEPDAIRFIYRYQYAGQEWQDVDIRVNFDRTPCNYGGTRSWFICPSCGRRCEVAAARRPSWQPDAYHSARPGNAQ